MMDPEFSVGLFPTESASRTVELARVAEDLGYAAAYIGDSQVIWREAYVILGAAGQATKRIRLGAGVTNPVTRDLSVIASAWSTLDELTDGRAVLGIGTGDSSLATIGLRPASLEQLETAISTIRTLIAGGSANGNGTSFQLPHARSGRRVPVYIAASSPKIHRVAGRIADGVIALVGVDPDFLRASRHELERGAAEGGRDLRRDGFRVICWTPCSINADGDVARDAVKAHVARILKRRLPFRLDPSAETVVRRIQAEYDYEEHMRAGTAHGQLVPDDMVLKFAAAGTPREVQSQLDRLASSGLVDEIAIVPHAHDLAERERTMRVVAEVFQVSA